MPVFVNQVNTQVINQGKSTAEVLAKAIFDKWFDMEHNPFIDAVTYAADEQTDMKAEDMLTLFSTFKGTMSAILTNSIQTVLTATDVAKTTGNTVVMVSTKTGNKNNFPLIDVVDGLASLVLSIDVSDVLAVSDTFENEYKAVYDDVAASVLSQTSSKVMHLIFGRKISFSQKNHPQDYLDKMQALSQYQFDANTQYTNEQQLMIKCVKDVSLVNSVAGCGKSTTLAGRFDALLSVGFLPYNIICTTFTNLGTDSLKTKLPNINNVMTLYSFFARLFNGQNQGRAQILVGDFLSMCKDILKPYGITLGYSDDIFDFMTYLDKKDPAVRNEILDKIMASDIYDKYISVEICQLLVAYGKLVPDMKAVPYGDVVQILLIDESQDLSVLDIISLNRLYEYNDTVQSIMFVGDTCQSIYSFRGALPTFMTSLSKANGVITLDLSTNYRSSADVICYADQSRYDGSTSGVGQSYTNGGVIVSHDKREMLDFITNAINNDESLAVLSNTKRGVNDAVDFIDAHLGVTPLDISTPKAFTFRNDKAREWSNDFFKKAKNGNINPMSAMSVWHTDVAGGIDDVKIYKSMTRSLAVVHASFVTNVNDQFAKHGLTMNNNVSTDSRYADVVDCVRVAFDAAIDSWIAEVNQRNAIRQSAVMTQLRESVLSGKGIYAGTVHASKGLEFDNVIYHKVTSRNADYGKTSQNIDYVARSRARYKMFDFDDMRLFINKK